MECVSKNDDGSGSPAVKQNRLWLYYTMAFSCIIPAIRYSRPTMECVLKNDIGSVLLGMLHFVGIYSFRNN